MLNQPHKPSILPATRVSEIKEYYFSAKLREIAALNATGADIISLAVGGPDRAPQSSVIETLCRAAHEPKANLYQPYNGVPELREAYCNWYDTYYHVALDCNKEVLPLIGSKEGIMHVSMAFLNPGDGVLLPNPGYPTYTAVSKLVGADIFNYDLTEEGNWEPDLDRLEQLPLERIKLMWVNYPHMPTGHSASRELFERLVAFGKKHDIVIVNDNPYSFILHSEPLSILQADGAREIAIELNSLSKSHNMPGWRMGMVASNSTFINWILMVKSNVDTGQFYPMMKAATEALKCDDDWFDDLNHEYRARRAIAEQIALALGCTFDPSQGGLFLWAKIPEAAQDCITFADKVLDEKRVFIVPGTVFGSNGARYVRISLCAPQDLMRRALERVNSN